MIFAAIQFEGPLSGSFDPLTFWVTVAVVALFAAAVIVLLIREAIAVRKSR